MDGHPGILVPPLGPTYDPQRKAFLMTAPISCALCLIPVDGRARYGPWDEDPPEYRYPRWLCEFRASKNPFHLEASLALSYVLTSP